MKRKEKVTAILLAGLMLVLSGCGNTAAGTGDATESAGTGGAETAENTQNSIASEDSFSIYQVGNDKLVFVMQGPSCEKTIAADEYQQADYAFDVSLGDTASVRMHSYGTNISTGLGTENQDYFPKSDQDRPFQSKTLYIGEVEESGIVNAVTLSGEYLARCVPNNGEWDPEANYDIAAGNLVSVIHQVSEEEYADVVRGLRIASAPTKPAQADWGGIYLTEDGYEEDAPQGYVSIEVSDNGWLCIDLVLDDEETEYFIEETSYDNAEYDYGAYVNAQADFGEEYDTHGNFSFTEEMGEKRLSYYCMTYDGRPDVNLYFTAFGEGFHVAPADFADEDPYGYISQKHPEDGTYFSPTTEDYVITCRSAGRAWTDEAGNDKSITYYVEELTSFDALGSGLGVQSKYVFQSEEDAAQYAELEYRDFVAANEVLYESESSGRNKMSMFMDNYSTGGYLDKHYRVFAQSSSDEFAPYVYYNKPVTEEEYSFSLDDLLMWKKIPNGSHYCTDTQDASLYTTLDSRSGQVNLSASSYNDLASGSMSTIHFHGTSAEEAGTDFYKNIVYVNEYTFSETTCELTQYQFEVADLENHGITWENYQSKTPSAVIHHTFDLTRVREN